MRRFNRIAISGPSGTGKTTLAKHISEVYGLPFISSSSSQLWKRYSFENHKEVQIAAVTHPGTVEALQWDILDSREKLYAENPEFVTDRGPIDLAVYYLMYSMLHGKYPDRREFLSQISMRLCQNIDAHILIRYMGYGLEDNGLRITDPYTQSIYDSVFEMVLKRNLLMIEVPVITIDVWDFSQRASIVRNFILR